MPSVISGQLTRHHNQPFYAQENAPKFFWAGCLGPLALVAVVFLLAIRGLSTTEGLFAIRGYILFILLVLVVQLVFGGSLFFRNHSSFAKGLLIGGGTIFVLMLLALIGAASIIGNFIH